MRGATLRQLRAFSTVAKHRSYARAASELHLTPSAVSLQIKELEQSIGLPLFGRSGRSSCLTKAGELLLIDVNRAFDALKDADETLTRLCGRETGVASVGMVSNATYFLPRLLATFNTLHPDIELQVLVANRDQLLKKLSSGEIDFAVMGQPPRTFDASYDMLATQPLGIVASPQHPLTRERDIPTAALADCKFIVRETGSGTRAAMDRFFSDAHIAPRYHLEIGSNESIKQAVMANMGLSFMSLQTARLELRDSLLAVLDVVGLPLIRSWHVVRADPDPLGPAAESLRCYILKHGNAFIAGGCDGLTVN